MAFLKFPNVEIAGIAACVPKESVDNTKDENLIPELRHKIVKVTGIKNRRVAAKNVTTADLCIEAAAQIIGDLNWNKDEIDAVIFVTQTPDYLLPSTSTIIQHRLGLSTSCLALDISLGCSGYVYGLTTIAGYLTGGYIKKALLLAGDTISKICSPNDSSTYPLFGDAGTATALEYKKDALGISAMLYADGKGSEAIIVKDGGARNPYTNESAKEKEYEGNIKRNDAQLALNGMDVFSFGISQAPSAVNSLLEKINIDRTNVDYFIFHQANKFMNENIRKKLKLTVEQVPYTLEDFGNTSSATIPLTLVSKLSGELKQANKLVFCGFGVGLSWGSIYIETNNVFCSNLVEI